MTLQLKQEDFKSFFQVPFEVYRDTAYVSPFKDDLKRFLKRDENPLFTKSGEFTYFTCLNKSRPVGRIVCHIHYASNERHGWKRAFFGFFDCAAESQVAKLLLDAASHWARSRGMTEIVGNFNLTAMQMIGILTQGFEHAPYSDQMWNPDYLPKLLEENGFSPTFPSSTYELDLSHAATKKAPTGRVAECLVDPDMEFRTITTKNLPWALESARQILNAGFDQNPMFVPVTKEEYDFQAKDLMLVLDPRISVVALKRGQPVGVVVCIPDLNPLLKNTDSRLKLSTLFHYLRFRANRKRAVIIYYSVAPAAQGKGVNGAMLATVISSLKECGYERLGVTWIADVNTASLRQMERIGFEPLHKLHLFRKDL